MRINLFYQKIEITWLESQLIAKAMGNQKMKKKILNNAWNAIRDYDPKMTSSWI